MTPGPGLTVAAAVAAATAVWLHGSPRNISGGTPRSDWLERVARRVRPGPRPDVAALLEGLAAELAAGQPTRSALTASAADLAVVPCPRAIAAARSGGDVAAALREDAEAPGARDLRALAACWEVAEHAGAGLSAAVDQVARALRESQAARAQLASEVAGARASARVLAVLPLLGLAIGQWIGADPVEWLFGSWSGRGVLAAGAVLQLVGMLWLRRIISTVTESL